MFLFYATFTIIWVLISTAHLYLLRRNKLLNKLTFESICVTLPISMSIYSFLNAAHWLSYKRTGYSSTFIHFFLLISVLLLRISCYFLVVLLVKGYLSLRVNLEKTEWRTLFGLVMFGTMGDLIDEAGDSRDWKSYVLTMTFQMTLALYCGVTSWRQGRAINSHLKKLKSVKQDYQHLNPLQGVEYNIYRYGQLLRLQQSNLVLAVCGAGFLIGGSTWLRWHLSNFIVGSTSSGGSNDSANANTFGEHSHLVALPIGLLDQFQFFGLYAYIAFCFLRDYLPPIYN